jgi:hypothetical protein
METGKMLVAAACIGHPIFMGRLYGRMIDAAVQFSEEA